MATVNDHAASFSSQSITDAQGEPVSREQEIAVLVAGGMPEVYARFVVAVQHGDLSGDLLMVDDEGKLVKEERRPDERTDSRP